MTDATHSPRDARVSVSGWLDTVPGRPRDASLPNNLPLQLSSFVGREKELAEVKRLLKDARLLTLTGPGGCGKTRLALAAADELVEGFEDGAWLVELTPLSDPSLVPQAVASALSVREQPGRLLTETLSTYLQTRKLLVVLDNCEHLIEACAILVEALLRSSPELRVLATSREGLGIVGEVAWPVPPLSLPDLRRQPDIESLSRYEAARLFVERAVAVKSSFALTEQNAASVAQVCHRLDGIPLAIELAAARTKGLSVEQIADRLDDCFGLLADGGRTALPRHQTLHATVDWSHELLPDEEQVLFRRLSVFAGGFTLEAAESVCAGEELERDEVLGLLSHLVDKSLVVAREGGGEARYRLLETMRQYGREKLNKSGGEAEVERRHARYYMGLAEGAERELGGLDQARWLTRLETEHDNLRMALFWSLGDRGDVGLGVRLAAALWSFWSTRGHVNEGRRWLESAVSRGGPVATSARAKILNGAGWLAMYQDEFGAATALIEEGPALYRELGNKEGIASSLVNLGSVAWLGQRDEVPVSALVEEAMKLRPQLEDRRTVARMLLLQSMVVLGQGDQERMVALIEESLALYREVRYAYGIVMCLTNLGFVTLAQGDHERTTTLLREDLRLAWELDHKLFIQYCLTGLGGRRRFPESADPRRAAVGGRGRHERDLRRAYYACASLSNRLRWPPCRRALATGRGGMDHFVGRGTGEEPRAGRRVRPGAGAGHTGTLPRRAQRQRGRCLASGSHRADRRRGRQEALHQPAHRGTGTLARSTANWGSTRAPRLPVSPSSTAFSDGGISFGERLPVIRRSALWLSSSLTVRSSNPGARCRPGGS